MFVQKLIIIPILLTFLTMATAMLDKEKMSKFKSWMAELFCKRCKEGDAVKALDIFKQCLVDLKTAESDAFVNEATKYKEGDTEPVNCRTDIGKKFELAAEKFKTDDTLRKGVVACLKKLKEHKPDLKKCFQFEH